MLLLVAQTTAWSCQALGGDIIVLPIVSHNLGAIFFERSCVLITEAPATAQIIKKKHKKTQYILKLYLVYSDATYISSNSLISAPPPS